MTVALQRFSFQDYLNHDGTDDRYELVEGELIPIAPGTGQHGGVMKFLERGFDREIERLELPWTAHRGDSESTVRTDYRAKRAEYNVLGIEEYLIVDPLAAKVTVCLLVDDLYEATEFVGEARIESRRFPELKLTAAAIFALI